MVLAALVATVVGGSVVHAQSIEATLGFSPGTVVPGDTTTLTISILNDTNSFAIDDIEFSIDPPSPSGASTPVADFITTGATTTCNASVSDLASISFNAGVLELSDGFVAANSQCTVTVDIQVDDPTSAGSINFVGSLDAGGNADGGISGVRVDNGQPIVLGSAVAESFSSTLLNTTVNVELFDDGVSDNAAPTVYGGDTDKYLVYTINNPNPFDLTGADFSSDLGGGLQVLTTGTPTGAGQNPLSTSDTVYTTCTGGTASASGAAGADGPTISLSDATIPANGSCTIVVFVEPGGEINGFSNTTTNTTFTSGTLTSEQGASNGNGVSYTVRDRHGFRVQKSFSPGRVGLDGASSGTSTVTFTLDNRNGLDTAALSLTDLLPTLNNGGGNGPMELASTPNLTVSGGGCGSAGTPSIGGTAAAPVVSGISLLAATDAAQQRTCTVSFDVEITGTGTYTNELPGSSIPVT